MHGGGGPNRPALVAPPCFSRGSSWIFLHGSRGSRPSSSERVTDHRLLCAPRLPAPRASTHAELGRQGVQDALVPGQHAEAQVVQQLDCLRPRLPRGHTQKRLQAPGFRLCGGRAQARMGPFTDACERHGNKTHQAISVSTATTRPATLPTQLEEANKPVIGTQRGSTWK